MDSATLGLLGSLAATAVTAVCGWMAIRHKSDDKKVDSIAASNTEAWTQMTRLYKELQSQNAAQEKRIDKLEKTIAECNEALIARRAERDILARENAALRGQLLQHNLAPNIPQE